MKKERDFFVKQEPGDSQMFICENIDVLRTDDVSSTRILQQKLDNMENEVKRMKKGLKSAERNYQHERSELMRKNKALSREIKSMAARLKQLQTGIESGRDANGRKHANKKVILGEQNRDASSDSSDEDVYEVERVLSHKTKCGKEMFLIRWKGFDSTHDTWERKDNLNCPAKLQEYFS